MRLAVMSIAIVKQTCFGVSRVILLVIGYVERYAGITLQGTLTYAGKRLTDCAIY